MSQVFPPRFASCCAVDKEPRMSDRRVMRNQSTVVAKILDGEAIIINLLTGAYYSTGGVGAAIWQCVEDQRTVAEIVAAITAAYDVSQSVAEQDVRRLLDELAAEELVTTATGDAASSW